MMLPSETFCILPWIHLSTRPDGRMHLCCRAKGHLLKDEENIYTLGDHNIEDIWNSQYMQDIRRKLLNNEKPHTCTRCWVAENKGGISKRMHENKKYAHLIESSTFAPVVNIDMIQYLDYRPGNTCNLKCRMCSSYSSSSIFAEAKKWPESFFHKTDNVEIYKGGKSFNWYNTKIAKKNFDKIVSNLKHFYITGGEPTIIPDILKKIKKLISEGFASDIELRLNTNLSVYNEDFYNALEKFKKVQVDISADAINDQLSYIRNPLDFKIFKNNLSKLIKTFKKSHNISVTVNCTVSVYNILQISDIDVFFRSIGVKKINYTLLDSPPFLDTDILPAKCKTKAIENLKRYISKSSKTLPKDTLKMFLFFINYLKTSSINEDKIKEFFIFTNTLDKVRGESFKDTFPELYNMIKEYDASK